MVYKVNSQHIQKALGQIGECPIDEYISAETNHPNVKHPPQSKYYIYPTYY